VEEVRAVLALVPTITPGASPFREPAFRAFFTRAKAGRAVASELVHGILPALAEPDAYRASCVAIACGSLVEVGADPMIAGLAIVERFRAALADDPPLGKDALTMFDRAAMAHLCRRMELRVAARAIGGLVDDFAAFDDARDEHCFTAHVFRLVDDLELLVLHPPLGKGFRVRLEAVATNAHLFTLLTGALVNTGLLPGEPLSEEMRGIATGEIGAEDRMHDDQRFRYDNYAALVGETELCADLGAFLPVDASPRDIPALPDGRRVVLLGPPQLGGRSWDTSFFANMHDALRSSVTVVETLAAATYQAVIADILRLRTRP
jgi:hypothetical protein